MEGNSLRGRVLESIREGILNGKYKENEELREAALANELGVSRTPVREALRQIELEGLVTIVPNKGARVTGITRKDVEDIYVIRSIMEGLCTRWAVENITAEQIQEMEEILLLSEFHQAHGNTEQLTALDGKFHQILYQASQSRIMEHVLTDFHKYVQMSRRISVQKEDRAEKSLLEHKAILEAIKARDAEGAEKLAHTHVMSVMENLHIQERSE